VSVVSELDLNQVEECRRLAAAWSPLLRALANEERLLIALWLAGSSRSVRELESVTGMSQSLVSYHLRELREAGLVTATPMGRTNRYRLSSVDVDELAKLMGSIELASKAA
jgi:DNA-binding transcriptional ArsR family regulator